MSTPQFATTLRVRRSARLMLTLAVAVATLVVPASPAAAAGGDITSVAGLTLGTGVATNVAQGVQDVAVFGSTVFDADRGIIRAINTTTGNEQVYAGLDRGSSEAFADPGDGGPATAAEFFLNKIAVDSTGNLFMVTQGNHVRKIDTSGVISTVAGTGVAGFSGDGGPATAAQLNAPTDIATDAGNNLYIVDNNRIRKIAAATGVITTVAGNGTVGFSGDGGPATSASITGQGGGGGVAVDATGNIYIAGASRIRKVDTSGIITTIAGTGTSGYSGDGGPGTAAKLAAPMSPITDSSGNLYMADNGTPKRVRKVDTSGIITTVAGTGTNCFPAFAPCGDGSAATAAQVNPLALAFDGSGNLLIAGNNRIRRVVGGTITTIAGTGFVREGGDGLPALQAQIGRQWGIGFDPSGNLYLASSEGVVRKIDTSGVITRFDTGTSNDVVGDSSGNVFVSDSAKIRKITAGVVTTYAGNGTQGCTGDGGPATSAQVSFTFGLQAGGLAVDGAGNLYLAQDGCNTVRKVDAATGIISTVAGGGTPADGLGDGGPATAAQLNSPKDVAVDPAGNLYIADAFNLRIRKVDTSGIITTVAGNGISDSFGAPLPYAGDGGPATAAALGGVGGIAVDGTGHLFLTSSFNRVRMVDLATGIISTIAGTGAECPYVLNPCGDGGPATSAQTTGTYAKVAVDPAGNLVVSEVDPSGSNGSTNPGRIRKISAPIPIQPARYVAADFDGDFKTDLSVYRPSTGIWYAQSSGGGDTVTHYGTTGDVPVPADYDGDHKTDVAIFRPGPNATWFVKNSSGGESVTAWGTTGDIPVPADYNGDGKTDIAVFRPSTGTWFVLGGTTVNWGTGGDIPVPGDYNGDHKADLAVFRPSDGIWYVLPSGGGPATAVNWGTSGDIPVPGDYNGDGITDLAVFRPSDGIWYVLPSGGGPATAVNWGTSGDIPVPGDYNGDGITDMAVFRPSNGTWYVLPSDGSPEIEVVWGTSGDVPLPLPYAIRSVFFP